MFDKTIFIFQHTCPVTMFIYHRSCSKNISDCFISPAHGCSYQPDSWWHTYWNLDLSAAHWPDARSSSDSVRSLDVQPYYSFF